MSLWEPDADLCFTLVQIGSGPGAIHLGTVVVDAAAAAKMDRFPTAGAVFAVAQSAALCSACFYASMYIYFWLVCICVCVLGYRLTL